MKKLGLGLALLALAGCQHAGSHEHMFHAGIVPAVDTDLEARSICSATSYEQDRNIYLTGVREMRRGLGIMQGPEIGGVTLPEGRPDQSPRSPSAYNNHEPAVADVIYLISQFEAELDGSYDAVVQTCRAYNQCMIQNDYTESDCNRIQGQWSDSQVRFHQLAERMADVRAEVAQSCGDCMPAHYRGHDARDERERGHYGDYVGERRREDAPDSYYGPFSAGNGQPSTGD